jgi:predicted Zn-dependent protease
LHQLPLAETEAEAAALSDPKSAHARDFLGEILVQAGKLTLARKEFEAALNLDPEFGTAQLNLAEVLLQQDQARAAIPLLEKAELFSERSIAQRAQALLQQIRPIPHK